MKRHRWSKEVSTIPFFAHRNGATACIFWRKRNEVVIKAGAILARDVPLNKDGSVGFSARFALSLRAEHEDAIRDYVTTEDIVLKSVNETGHLLYFAGCNSWLEFKDEQGRTLEDYTAY